MTTNVIHKAVHDSVSEVVKTHEGRVLGVSFRKVLGGGVDIDVEVGTSLLDKYRALEVSDWTLIEDEAAEIAEKLSLRLEDTVEWAGNSKVGNYIFTMMM